MSSPGESDRPNPVDYNSERLANVASAMRGMDHPKEIGRYIILESIGEGGMGTVYRAEQREPIHRIVAIKLIKLGMDTREVIKRFEAERQVLAMMDHPNVARVIDAGATASGSPYFVMEFVKGQAITAFADQNKLDVRQRLELFTQACAAVQHAHQKGIIHRDLKPSNILVTSEDDQTRVKVIDFGVAKALDQREQERSYFTEAGRFVGTPEYMAPEQANGHTNDIDTRGDVYSLGVVLYELLSGSLPFDAKTLRSAGYQEIQRIIREVDPPRPSTRLSGLGEQAREEVASRRHTPVDALQKQLKGELEWIPLKAMRKERSERYASATELSDDIENYLSNRPLRAGPESSAYRAKKFLRRNKGAVAGAALVLVVLFAGVIGTSWQAIRARRQTVIAAHERDTAQQERDNAQAVVKFFTDGVIGAADPAKTHGKPVTVQQAVDLAADKIDKSLSDHPLVEAAVRLSISDTYRALGKYDRALPFAKRSYEIRRAQLGEENWDTIIALSRYVNILIALQRPADAEPLARQILDESVRIKGPDDLETLAAQNNLANVLYMQGRIAEAVPIMLKHYQVMQGKFGDDSYDTMAAAQNYGAVLERLGRLTEAEQIFHKTYQWSLKKYGIDDPDTLEFGNALAVIENELGNYSVSTELGKTIWEARIRLLGKDNPDTMSSCQQYAIDLARVGRGEEGAAMLKQLLDAQTARDPNARSTLNVMASYGEVLTELSRDDEAAAIDRAVWEKRKTILEKDHPDTLTAEVNYAGALVKLNRAGEAEPLAREAADGLSRRLGPQNRQTLLANGKLASALLKLDRPADAELLAKSALDGLQASLGPQHPDVRRAAQLLSAIFRAENRPADAAQILSQYAPPATAPSGK